MHLIKQQIEIAWPVRALFHYMADSDSHSQWRPHVVKSVWHRNTKNIPGSQLIDTQRVLGKDSAVVWKLTEIRAYQKRVLLQALARSNTYYIMEYEPLGERTRLTLTIRVESGDQALATRTLHAVARKSLAVLQGLKQTLETDQ